MVYELARRDARRTREEWAGHDQPITFESLKAIASGLGASVHVQSLEPGVSGFIIKYVGSNPRIYISSDEGPVRQVFTLAHELGHLVERRDLAKDEEYSFIDYRQQGEINLREFYANEYAGELLMPAIPFLQSYREHGVKDTALRFNVSESAAQERYRRLKVHPHE